MPNTPWPKPVPTDGLWIIILGTKGYVGLTLFYLALILPAALFVWRFPVRLWGDPRVAAGSLAAVLLSLYMVDCLMNGFPNMIYVTLAGGLIGLEPKQLRAIAAGRGGKAVGQAGRGEPRVAALGAVAAGPGPHGGQIVLADRYRSLGRSFKQEGRPDEAESAWRQALDVLTALMEAEPDSPGCGGCGATAPTTWPGFGPITPIRPDATRMPPWRWPDGWWSSAPTPRSTGTRWERPTTAPATTPRRSPPSITPRPSAAARPSTTSSWPWRMHGWGIMEEADCGSPMLIFGMERDYPGHPELVRLLRRGPIHPRRGHRGTGRGPLTQPGYP